MSDTFFALNRVESRIGSIALVTVDNGEDYNKPTTLGRSAFESAVRVIDELESGEWAAMVVTGKPFVFCVGADIDAFAGIRSKEDAIEGTHAGHELFARIRALPFPTVAAINGACLGGGLELALHCDARTIASSVRHFGFPEVALVDHPRLGRNAARAEARRAGCGGAADRAQPAAPEPAASRRRKRSSSASPTGCSIRSSSSTTRSRSPSSSSRPAASSAPSRTGRTPRRSFARHARASTTPCTARRARRTSRST